MDLDEIYNLLIFLSIVETCISLPRRTNPGSHESHCDTMSACPVKPYNFDYNNVPWCYCDDMCESYEDCCKEYRLNSTKNDTQTTMDGMTCLTIDDDNAGFWVVNRCGQNGPICNDNKTLSNVLMNLPVTDDKGVHYFGIECALCNNVTHFTRWGVFVGENQEQNITWQNIFQSLINMENGSQTISRPMGPFYVAVPPEVTLRVCYPFTDITRGDDFTCPSYQNPVRLVNKNGFKPDLYKNLECCRSCESCSKMNIRCVGNAYLHLKPFEIKRSVEGIRSNYLRPFGVLLRFGDKNSRCTQKKGKCLGMCVLGSTSCSQKQERKELQVWRYPLHHGRVLKIVWSNSYTKGMAEKVISAIVTFLLESEWKIRLGDKIYFSMNNGRRCGIHEGSCTVLEHRYFPISYMVSTATQVKSLNSWTDKLIFAIKVEGNVRALASFSRLPNESFNCSCVEIENGEIVSDERSINLLSFNWNSKFKECSLFELNVTNGSLKVSCSSEFSGEMCILCYKAFAALCFFIVLLLSK